jgi:hypothetical protein
MWHWCWLYVFLRMPSMVYAAGLTIGPRSEVLHPGTGHEAHLSGPTVAVTRDGVRLVSWIAQEAQGNQLYLSRPAAPGTR